MAAFSSCTLVDVDARRVSGVPVAKTRAHCPHVGPDLRLTRGFFATEGVPLTADLPALGGAASRDSVTAETFGVTFNFIASMGADSGETL